MAISMETVKVSRKYQVVIPEKLRDEAKIKPGDKMVAIAKHGILQYVPVRSLKQTKGMISGLDSAELRDETDRS
jgi:AbrB family looped-hinge helix DNA binding protein